MLLSRALLALVLVPAAAAAQSRITLADLGPGPAGRILRDALSRPHKLVPPDSAALTQRRGDTERTSLVVLDRTVYIGGKVEGDVIVVDADLFVRAGAEITGRAVAIGGGVYPSALAYVGGGTQSFHDHTFDVAPQEGGYRLSYRSLLEGSEPPLLLPGVYGLRLPSYDRVNGVSVPYGPAVTFGGGRVEFNFLGTYRSDLGVADPSASLEVQMSRRTRLEARVERGSFTNDAWIYPDYLNSANALIFGEDTRNWYRADRAELTLRRGWEMTRSVFEPFIGGRFERSRPVGPIEPIAGDSSGPWSLFGRRDSLGMLRPNPQIIGTEMLSGLGGFAYRWEEEQGLQLRSRTVVEVGAADVLAVEPVFVQATTDLDLRFPTFGEQSYRVEVHWVTSSDDLPMQRFAYLGGPGTMPFLEILEQGGGELLLVDQRYSIPLTRIVLPLFGIPTLQLRHRVGSAGVSELPALEQMIGVGLSLTVIRGEVRLDPASGRVKFATGFTFAR